MKLYHGTNASNVNDVIDNPNMTKNINGFGFYLTNDINVARKYGKTVVVYELSNEIANSMNLVVRPIDQRYVEELATYTECAESGMEYVVTNKRDLDILTLDADDTYTI